MQEKYIEPQITGYLFHKAIKNHIPIWGTFELSPLCNFNCKMCYVHQQADDLKKMGKSIKTPDFWLELARQAKEQGMLYLLLTGGEPFLYPDFWMLYEELVKMGFVISINSNGSLIDEKIIEKLKKYPPARINITLYGASDETYERLCGIKKGYSRTIRSIQLLKEAGISVKLNCSLTPTNVEDLPKMIRYAEEQKLIIAVATYMFPPVRVNMEEKGKNHRFTPQEMAEYNCKTILYQRGKEYLQEYAKNVIENVGDIPQINECMEREGNEVRCRAGRGIFWTTWEGKITPCGMLPIPAISLEHNSFAQAWERLTAETAKIRLAKECKECPNQSICNVCAGMIYGENLDLKKRPQYLCDYVKALKKECGKIKK